MEKLLQIRDLSVEFDLPKMTTQALDRVSFEIGRGERVGLVGESGSGKSILSLAIMQLVPRPGHISSGTVTFDGRQLTDASEPELDDIRGRRIALIPQDASLALNPVLKIGEQLHEVLHRHTNLSNAGIREKSVQTLRKVGLAAPERVLRSFSSELSGGMKQRVGIALALCCDPELLIADDPTSAVDVTIQAQILAELRDLTEKLNVSLLFITHDLRVVSSLCSRIIVMYGGQVVEIGDFKELLDHPRHPYTRALVRCSPTVEEKLTPLPVVPGAAHDAEDMIPGCRFHPRCLNAVDRCRSEVPELTQAATSYACWNPLGGYSDEQG